MYIYIYSVFCLLTTYADLPRRLHRRAVTVVGVTRYFVHIPRHVMDDGHHVSGRLLSDQSAGNVQWYGRWRCTHGDAQHGHAATLHDQIYRMYRRRLYSAYEKTRLMLGDINRERKRNGHGRHRTFVFFLLIFRLIVVSCDGPAPNVRLRTWGRSFFFPQTAIFFVTIAFVPRKRGQQPVSISSSPHPWPDRTARSHTSPTDLLTHLFFGLYTSPGFLSNLITDLSSSLSSTRLRRHVITSLLHIQSDRFSSTQPRTTLANPTYPYRLYFLFRI